MKRLLLFFFPLLTAGALQSQIINREPLSQRITGYRIDARLDPASKIVYGSMDAFWVNKSSDLVADARLHMYMNAYSSSKTTFFREIRSSAGTKESDYGWIKITSMTNRKGKDLTRNMQFISPDDGNADDKSVLKVDLPAAIKPGDTLFLKIFSLWDIGSQSSEFMKLRECVMPQRAAGTVTSFMPIPSFIQTIAFMM
jgi:hypothetical protein